MSWKSYAGVIFPNVSIFMEQAYKQVIKVIWGNKGEAPIW